LKLFIEAQAAICVPSTEKCSSDNSPSSFLWFMSSARTFRATSASRGRLEVLDIDDTFCAAHGGQQLAFWNAHEDERGFAFMHIYHVASGTPIATILRPARTPNGREVRTVIKHVTKHLRQHWPNTRIVWRGDSHYGRVEAMEWAGGNGADYIFGLAELGAPPTPLGDQECALRGAPERRPPRYFQPGSIRRERPVCR
jgi:hypothetical protein